MASDSYSRNFCTTREAAEMLGVSIGTVQLWTENGLLEAWKTAGGHRRVVIESVERLLRKHPDAREPQAAPPDAAADAGAQRPTVLVVEDDLNLLRLYETRISRWPGRPQVICLNNAVLALLRIGRRAPEMLILDLNMPGMDGFAMLHALRHSGAVQNTAIAVVTGLDPAALDARGGLPGDVDVFPKPIPFDRLMAVWNQCRAPAGPDTGAGPAPVQPTPRT